MELVSIMALLIVTGKKLKNATVQGVTFTMTDVSRHNVSPFPALSGATVKDLTIIEINLIPLQSGFLRDVYVGGLTSYV